ncbi:MAG: TIGR04168 family protein [Oscillatoria sp. SIO1A7]|nr:TIGR04168 family protein [Oscillatoria sp. SIO1A7]
MQQELKANDRNNSQKSILVAVIGDVHEQWEEADGAAIKALGVDLALFVGDFGNESVAVTRAIAALDIPKAVILGNHDAWWTATPWGKKKRPPELRDEDRVRQQLDLLGETHVGYGKLDFPDLGLTVVGGRPFSWGGSKWQCAVFYRERFGVNGFVESRERILDSVKNAACETIVFIGHNGPRGLGDSPEDPCGKDWKPIGGDFGDPDLQGAIADSRELGKNIPLVAFGHMHHRLRHTKERLRKFIDCSPEGTVYLNAARVPRILEKEKDFRAAGVSFASKARNFSLVSLVSGVVSQASLVWLDQNLQTVSEEILYCRPAPAKAQSA